jgi:hypothetical protein
MRRKYNLTRGTTEMMGLRVMIISVISEIFKLFKLLFLIGTKPSKFSTKTASS